MLQEVQMSNALCYVLCGSSVPVENVCLDYLAWVIKLAVRMSK